MSVSCKSEADKIAEETAFRNAIVDSTISQFQKKLLKSQIDSVFSKYNFNGSVSVQNNEELLYVQHHGFENFDTKKKARQ